MKDEESINLPSKFHPISEKEFMLFKIADMINIRFIYQNLQGKSAIDDLQPEMPIQPLTA